MSRKPKTTDTCSTVTTPIYKPFPNPDRALFGDFLSWAKKGAYFILQNGETNRYFHKNCGGVYGSPSKPDMISKSQREPVIVIDLSRYPILIQEGEWDAYLTYYCPEYKNCMCPHFRYVLNGEGVNREYYVLTSPYFYLTGLNQEGESCFHYTKLIKGF